MAQRTVIELLSDLSGKDGDETVKFGLDGVDYEVDLTAREAEQLRKALEPYRDVARRTGGRKSRGAAASGSGTGSAAAVREWARAAGHTVPERGRIPAAVREAYAAAN